MPESIENLTQLKTLDLSHNQFSSLPESIGNLTQLACLWADNNRLSSLPESFGNLAQLFLLRLDSNQFSNMPERVFELQPTCTVYVEGNLFSASTVRRIQEFSNTPEYQGPRIIFSIHDRSQMALRSLDELLDDLCKAADKERLVLVRLKENAQLSLWLNRLVDVGDYKQSETRKNLAVMIYDALCQAEKDDAYRATFEACLLDADTTCGDRMALSILYLGLNLQIQAAEDEGDLERMADLFWRGTYAVSELEKIAEEKINSLKGVDPVEVYLGYPVKLKKDLKLPIDIDSMLYPACSGITDEDLADARYDLERKLSDEEKRLEFLVDMSTWTKMLEKDPRTKEKYKELNAQRFESSEDPALAVQAESVFREGLLELTRKVLTESNKHLEDE